MTSTSEKIAPHGLHKKVEFHIPEDKHKSIIGFQSMTSPTVLNLLRVEQSSSDSPTPVPVSRSASNERLLKDESIMNLQGREVLFATGIFFLVSLSVAFIFIIATTTLDKFSQPAKEKTTSPQIKCTINTTPLQTSSCESIPLDFSEANLRGKFGKELRQKLCEISLNSICQHETRKFNKIWTKWPKSSKLHSSFLQSNSIDAKNQSECRDDINAIQHGRDVNNSISFNNSYEVEISDPQNNLTEQNNVNEIDVLQLTNITESNKIKERNSDRILPRLSRSQGHNYIKKFWVFLQNPKIHKQFCLGKIKMAANFFKKCVRRQKVSINALFSFIIPGSGGILSNLHLLRICNSFKS